MDNNFTQIGIQYSSFGDNAQIEIQQTIVVPRKSTPIPSDVRQGSPNFVGRVDDLRGLHEALQKEKIVSVCAVRGMGGVGKTELAIQYALSQEFQQRYVACYWFSLNEGNLASLVLQKAAPYLAIPEEIQKSDDVYEQVKWCWQNWHPPEGEVLVILDDVKSLDDIPKQAMPINPRFKVMLTTRQRNLSPSFRELQLGVLPEDEALELLKRIVDRDSSSRIEDELETAKEISRYLGYLPLALELAATYLVEDEMLSLGEYWQQLNLQDRSISDEMVKYITAERGVVSAFALSWLRLRDLSQQVAMLLGRFAPADIPWQDLVEPTVKSLGWDEGAVRKGRIQLANLHLISLREQKNIDNQKKWSIGIHSLLREYFRWQADRVGQEFIHSLQRSITSFTILYSKLEPDRPIKADIERIRPLIPHWEIISCDMLDDVVSPDSDGNLVWTFLLIARFYRNQGLYSIAEKHYLNCLAEVEARLGSDSYSFAKSLYNLGSLYYLQGKYDRATSFLIEAQTILGEQGLNANDSINALNALGLVYTESGKFSEAEEYYLLALDRNSKDNANQWQLTERSLIVSDVLNNLALLNYKQGKYSEAEHLYHNAIAVTEEHLGTNHPDVATSLNNLANLYFSQGKYENAEPLYIQAMTIREQELHENHPAIAETYGALSSLYVARENYTEAEAMGLKALDIFEKSLGVDHPNTATSLFILGQILVEQEKFDEAESHFLRSLSMLERQLNENHPKIIPVLNEIGSIYHKQMKHNEAESLFKRALDISKKVFGAGHNSSTSSLGRLANLYRSQKKHSEAETLYLLSLSIVENHLGEDYRKVATSLINLAGFYQEQGKYNKAKILLERAILILEKISDSDNSVAKILDEIARLYMNHGMYTEAEMPLLKSLAILEKTYGCDHFATENCYFNLSVLYLKLGKYIAAEQFILRSISCSERNVNGNIHLAFGSNVRILASIYTEQEKYDDAEQLLLNKIPEMEKHLGLEHVEIAECYNNLAEIYRREGRYQEAEPLFRRVIQLMKTLLGDGHPSLLTVQNNLGLVLKQQKKYSDAIAIYQVVLSAREEILDAYHPDIAVSLNNLGGVYYAQGKLHDAVYYIEKAFRISMASLGNQHPQTNILFSTLANIKMQIMTGMDAATLELAARFNPEMHSSLMRLVIETIF
jgi:tetratricopeptide (TPR) repeat protein